MFALSLSGPVGLGLDNSEEDVKALATYLRSLGHPGARDAAETGFWDDAFDDDLRQFQRAQGLTVDGLARPGGETERALNGSIGIVGTNVVGNKPPQPSVPLQKRIPAAGNDLLERLKEMRDAAARPFNLLDPFLSPKRFDPFAIAGANAGRVRSLLDNGGAEDPARRDASSAFLSDNPLTGKPFRLQPVGPATRTDVAPTVQRPTSAVVSSLIPKLAQIAAQNARKSTPSPAPTLDEEERIPTMRGLRYRPDPMGRLGQGDWLDADGEVIDEAERRRMLAEAAVPQRPAIRNADRSNDLAEEKAPPNTLRPGETLADTLRRAGKPIEQTTTFLASDFGAGVAAAISRFESAIDEKGRLPAAVWQSEFRRLGIEVPPTSPGIVQVAEKDDRGTKATPMPRLPIEDAADELVNVFDRVWKWLNKDVAPLAGPKRSTIRQIDDTIRALEAERERPGLSLFERWQIDTNLAQLQVQRSKINVFFPSSTLDLAGLGIAAIGMVKVGSRAIPLFRQGNKVFDADDLAKGTWRQVKPIEKLDEYTPAEWRIYFEQKYGRANVKSTTIPGTDSQWWQLRNQQKQGHENLVRQPRISDFRSGRQV